MISTHILDTQRGQPAVAVRVELYATDGLLLAQALSDADGRVRDFGCSRMITPGRYRLVFMSYDYFQRLGIDSCFAQVVVDFIVGADQQHCHIPLLLSPFAYSTYRGS